MMVEDKVIVECKATSEYQKIFEVQALTYLRLSGLRLALVVNFGEKLVKEGIRRVANKLYLIASIASIAFPVKFKRK